MNFEGGNLFRLREGQGFRVVEIHGAIAERYSRDGEPGFPTSDELTTPDGVGRVTHFTGWQGDYSLFWTPSTGVVKVLGVIRTKWAATGWERGPLGHPLAEQATGGHGTAHQRFQFGNVYAGPDGICFVKGAILDEWGRGGWEHGPLGSPTTDELATPDGVGRYNHFTGGSIYWTPATGARTLDRPMRDLWARSGWERGVLGYPTTSTAPTPDGLGRHTQFQGGSAYIAYIPDAQGTRWYYSGIVRGAIRDKWASTGWERGPLGYPQGDEFSAVSGVIEQHFQNGRIAWDTRTRKFTVTYAQR